jgi:hypothetical protein
MNRVLIIFLIWIFANLTFSFGIGIYEYIFFESRGSEEFDFGFWGTTILALFAFSIYSMPLLIFLQVFYYHRKITHKEFIKQVTIIYSILLFIILIIVVIITKSFASLFILLPIFISIPFVVLSFKFIKGEDVPN